MKSIFRLSLLEASIFMVLSSVLLMANLWERRSSDESLDILGDDENSAQVQIWVQGWPFVFRESSGTTFGQRVYYDVKENNFGIKVSAALGDLVVGCLFIIGILVTMRFFGATKREMAPMLESKSAPPESPEATQGLTTKSRDEKDEEKPQPPPAPK